MGPGSNQTNSLPDVAVVVNVDDAVAAAVTAVAAVAVLLLPLL